MKVALVCDWLTNVGGAEKVLLKIHETYPEAPIYTSQYDPKGIDWFSGADVRTGSLQKYPAKMRRLLGPLRQRWFSRLELAEYDLIISVTGAEAKAVKSGKWLHEHGTKREKKRLEKRGVKINPNGVHICYCHVPTQYYWQMYDDYVRNPGFGIFNPLVRVVFRLLVKPLRKADYEAGKRPDYFITISSYAKGLIKKYYDREAIVIHPPVEVKTFSNQKKEMGDYYVTTSRQVNWKRIDLAVEACKKMKRKLLVVGEGPEHKNLVNLATGSEMVKFLPLAKKERLAELLAEAKGYLFPSLEPFGIAPVEALAAGCPVIAYGEGGARDYVHDGENGVLFREQTVESLMKAITRFEQMKFDRKVIRKSAEGFSEERFDKEMRKFIDGKIK